MLLELFEYTINNYNESLSLLDTLRKAGVKKRKVIKGLVL